jgi:hypothetical protein
MINLLSLEDKKELHAARRNTIWVRYTFLVLILLVTVNIILALTIFFIQTQARAYEQRIATNTQLSNLRYKGTQAKAKVFREELATAKTILDSETNYSTVIVSIAHTIPPGCVLSTLVLNDQLFNTPQTLSFKCRGPSDVLRLKTALEKDTRTFDKVNIVSTTTASGGEPVPYPTSISMSLIVKKPTPSETSGL